MSPCTGRPGASLLLSDLKPQLWLLEFWVGGAARLSATPEAGPPQKASAVTIKSSEGGIEADATQGFPLFALPNCISPEADTALLKQPEKLLVGLDLGGPPAALGAPRRRGSMPVPYKHQLRRAQAVDELDWPPQNSSSSSCESLGPGEAGPAPDDGVFKVMLVGESGVGKSTLAGTFGDLQGDSAHEPENPGIWGSLTWGESEALGIKCLRQ